MNVYRVLIYFVLFFLVSIFYAEPLFPLTDENAIDWIIINCVVVAAGLIWYLIDSTFIHQKQRIRLSTKYYYLTVGLFIAMGVSTLLSIDKHKSFALLCLQTGLVVFTYCCYIGLRETNYNKLDYGYVALVLAPLMTLVWLPASYYFHLTRGWDMQWHGSFANIRFYDDVMLPLIFLLWYQPKLLRVHPRWVFILSTFYLFSLWVDGARAVWISIFITLLFFLFVMRQYFKEALKFLWLPIISIFTSWVMHLVISHLLSGTSHGLLRTTSSLRWPAWLECWDIWLNNPVFGVGGLNYEYYGRYLPQAGNPHNVIVQQVMDWGVAGIVCITLMVLYTFKLSLEFFRHIKKHDFHKSFLIKERYIFVYMAVFASLINAVMSSSSFYPYVQLLMCVLIAQVFVIYNKMQGKNHMVVCFNG